MPQARTLYDKIWDRHVVRASEAGPSVVYMDRHLVHEFTSPQAFAGMRAAGRGVRRADATLAVMDHAVSTAPGRDRTTGDPESQTLITTLRENCGDFGVRLFGLGDSRQGIVHVVGPEQGFVLPGETVACGDAHVATHGALGALAFPLGISDVEHVLATQTLIQERARNLRITVNGRLGAGVSAKDLILAIIGRVGHKGAAGCVIEYTGPVVEALSMEGRMTVCNMSVEMGAKAGLMTPDETTIAFLRNRPMVPVGDGFDAAADYWRTLKSDVAARYDAEVTVDADAIAPQITWGTRPEDVLAITDRVPDPASNGDRRQRLVMQQALDYMGLEPGTPMEGIGIDRVFIGSCVNGRIEDLRAAAAIVKSRHVAGRVEAVVVPGSGLVKAQAEAEGLDRIFLEAGFGWREPGCSMCIALNGDRLNPGERCASTSNRNFEGWQGSGGRTHLLSPAMAAAAAITGTLTDVRGLI